MIETNRLLHKKESTGFVHTIFGVVMEPSEELSEETIMRAAYDWMKNGSKLVEGDSIGGTIIRAEVNLMDYQIGDAIIKKGSWVIEAIMRG